jgi:hypothetical protein
MFLRCLGFASVVVCLGLSADLGAQKGGKPKPVDTPAMTTFRCLASDPQAESDPCQAVSDATDRVRDDGDAYGSYLARVASSGFYALSLANSGRALSLALGAPIPTSPVPCQVAENCNPDRVNVVNSALFLQTASIEVKPLVATATGYSELSGLLWGMNCTDVYPAKVHYTFTLPSGDGHWGFNFNSVVYPGSNNAVITRASDGVRWTVESNGLIGELLSWGHSGLRRPHSGPSHEGFFYANFKFMIEVVSLPSPSVGCS